MINRETELNRTEYISQNAFYSHALNEASIMSMLESMFPEIKEAHKQKNLDLLRILNQFEGESINTLPKYLNENNYVSQGIKKLTPEGGFNLTKEQEKHVIKGLYQISPVVFSSTDESETLEYAVICKTKSLIESIFSSIHKT